MELAENQSDVSQSDGEEEMDDIEVVAQVADEEQLPELSQDLLNGVLGEEEQQEIKPSKPHRITFESNCIIEIKARDCERNIIQDLVKRVAMLENKLSQVKAARQKRKQAPQGNYKFVFYKSNNADSKFPYKFSLAKHGKMSSMLKSKIILVEYEFINIQPATRKAIRDAQQPHQQQQIDGDEEEEEKLTEIKPVLEYGIISHIMSCCDYIKTCECFENGKNMKDFKLTDDVNEEDLRDILTEQVLPNVFC